MALERVSKHPDAGSVQQRFQNHLPINFALEGFLPGRCDPGGMPLT